MDALASGYASDSSSMSDADRESPNAQKSGTGNAAESKHNGGAEQPIAHHKSAARVDSASSAPVPAAAAGGFDLDSLFATVKPTTTIRPPVGAGFGGVGVPVKRKEESTVGSSASVASKPVPVKPSAQAEEAGEDEHGDQADDDTAAGRAAKARRLLPPQITYGPNKSTEESEKWQSNAALSAARQTEQQRKRKPVSSQA